MAIHGVNVTEGALGAPPINLPDVSNIGLVGTAPDAVLPANLLIRRGQQSTLINLSLSHHARTLQT